MFANLVQSLYETLSYTHWFPLPFCRVYVYVCLAVKYVFFNCFYQRKSFSPIFRLKGLCIWTKDPINGLKLILSKPIFFKKRRSKSKSKFRSLNDFFEKQQLHFEATYTIMWNNCVLNVSKLRYYVKKQSKCFVILIANLS